VDARRKTGAASGGHPHDASDGAMFRSAPERSLGVAVEKQSWIEPEADVNNIIYIIGLIVVILAILSFFGLR
jgi:hypothetical protein